MKYTHIVLWKKVDQYSTESATVVCPLNAGSLEAATAMAKGKKEELVSDGCKITLSILIEGTVYEV